MAINFKNRFDNIFIKGNSLGYAHKNNGLWFEPCMSNVRIIQNKFDGNPSIRINFAQKSCLRKINQPNIFTMKQLIAFLLPLFFAACRLFAQAPASFWTPGSDKTFNSTTAGNPNDGGRTALPIEGGGFLIVGLSSVNLATGLGAVWAVKLDSTGKKIAEKTYSGAVSMFSVAAAVETPNGYVIVSGKTDEAIDKNRRFMVAKADLEIIEGTEQLSAGAGSSCVARLKNGFLLMGSPGAGGNNRTAQLEVLNENDLTTVAVINSQLPQLPETWGKNLQLILPTPDGGCFLLGEDIVLSGETACNGGARSNIWVCRLDAKLTPLWSRTYGGITTDVFTDAEIRENDNLMVLGRTECRPASGVTGPNNIGTGSWVFEINPQGELLYIKSLAVLEPVLNSDRVLGFGLLRGCPDALLVSGNYRLINGKMTGYVAKVRLGASTRAITSFSTPGLGTWKREFTAFSIYAPEDILQLPFTRKIFAWGTAAAAVTGDGGDIWASVFNPDATACAGNPFSDAVITNCGEIKLNQTTAIGAADRGRHGNYLGAPNITATYDGPDKTYKMVVPSRTNLRITLEINATNLIDLDLFLFGSNAAGNPINGPIAATTENNKNAIDFKQEILERVVDPGTYYLVVDGRTANDKGLFNLKFECGCTTCNCAESATDLPDGRKILTDNFEQYKTGNLPPQSTRWTPDPASPSINPPGQIVKTGNETQTLQMSGVRRSVFYDLAPLPNNRYRLSFQMFVTANKTAGYKLLKALSAEDNTFYSAELSFMANGSGNLKGDNNASFTYTPGKWMTLTHLIDIGKDSFEFWIDQQYIGKWKFNDNSGSDPNNPIDDDQMGFYLPRLLFSSEATSDYRVDNLCLWEKTPCTATPVANTCLVSPGSSFYTSVAAARCNLYTSKELKDCRSVCETNATVFHREPAFQGSIGPAAPPSLALLSDCVKGFYSGNNGTSYPKLADLILFYNESSKNIEINLNGGNNTEAFVFQCLCEDALNGIFQINDDVVTANGCEQLCLGRVGGDYSDNSPRPRGYYYLLLLGNKRDNYTLNIIPEGPCGAPIVNLKCGTPISDNLNNELNTFKKSDNAYRIYNGPRSYEGRDKIYTFTISRPQYIDLSLSSGTGMGMFLFTDQCGDNPILYRELPEVGGTVVLDSFFLPPAQYYLSIDEYEPNKSGNYVLRLDQCTDASVSELLHELSIQSDQNCPVDNAQKHTVTLESPDQFAQPTTLNLNDLVHFKFKDDNNLDRTSTFLFWNGAGLNFSLPADAGGNNPKCGYLPGDPLQLAIQHYDNTSSEYVDYALGVSGPTTFQVNGNSNINGLTPIKTVFFHVNPQILNPSNLGKTYTVRVTSSGFNWKIEESPGDFPWIKIPLPTGSNNQQRNIEFYPNPGPGPREALLIVRSTDAGAIQYTDTIRVVQAGDCSAKPNYTIETPTAALCAGQSVTLSAKLPAGANPAFYSYQWSSGKTSQIATEIIPDIAASATTYTVTIFDRVCGSAGTATKTMTINASEWRLMNTPVQTNITDDRAGTSVAFEGEWAVVGAPQFDNGAATNVGRVLLYRRSIAGNQETWVLHKELKASDGTSNHQFGYRVSIQGNFILVGAPGGDGTTPTKPGAAYYFFKDQGGVNQWGEIKKIAQTTLPANNNFGAAVSLYGDYAFVGADAANAIFVYHRNQGGTNQWGLVKTLTGATASQFGSSVSLEGNLAIVGAKNHNVAAIANAGTAIIYQRKPLAADRHNWVSVDTIIPPVADNLKTGDQFGHSVALQGDYLLIGAPRHDNNNADPSFDNGAAWLYERDPAFAIQWKKRRKITGAVMKSDNYGSQVTLGERYAVVGAGLEGSTDNGAIYLYHRNKNGNNSWGLVRKLTAPTTAVNPSFGFGSSTAISAQNLLVGAAFYDTTIINVSSTNRGRGYFFRLACLTGAPPGESALETVAVEGVPLSGLSLNCSPIPFRDELTITVTATAPLEALVQICDVAGRTIETLHEGYLQEENTFHWAAESVQAGMYYVVVRSADGKMMKPVVLMR